MVDHKPEHRPLNDVPQQANKPAAPTTEKERDTKAASDRATSEKEANKR